ncbi:GntR family transcriptional regulator [Uliginosibacterium sp. H1]|uniref:GntR family transcriptional regulator n=1 Tax=Uliginosibacterium sp. H1 TaxID=3114757 RepID=UPI002E19C1E9|nr:GntR family transcriptional regulator [Uliginosibacterium sp. H1]
MKRRQPIAPLDTDPPAPGKADATRPATAKAGPRKRDNVGAADARIYDAIFQAVMLHRLKPGMKLPEPQLCELFGVSRTLVRKALQRLAGDHIVDLRPNRGAVVASPTPEETREIFAARRAIEAAIMPLVIANATPASLRALREAMAAEHEALHQPSQREWAQRAGGFHTLLAEQGGNRVLAAFLTQLMSRCSLIVALYEAPGDALCEHEEHAELVERIAAGDVSGAIALMDAHLHALEARIRLPRPEEAPDLAALLGLGS